MNMQSPFTITLARIPIRTPYGVTRAHAGARGAA
jgi:hypothetical protein